MRSAALAVAMCWLAAPAVFGQAVPMRPDDLFRFTRIGATVWSPDQARAAVEIHQPSAWLTPRIPTAQIAIVDAASARLRVITPPAADVLGFFGPSWSPDGRSLVFFSVDRNAFVQAWLWSGGTRPPRRLIADAVADGLLDPPRGLWTGTGHVVLRLREPGSTPDGPLYVAIQRGRNVADVWRRAREAAEATVSVFDAGGGPGPGRQPGPRVRLVSVDTRTGAIVTLAAGPIHVPRLGADGRTLSYREESPPVHAAPAATFLGPDARGESMYDPVNWGAAVRHVDARTGAPVPAPAKPSAPPPAASPDAERPSLRVANDPKAGTTLWLRRPGQAEVAVWTGNTWIAGVATGRAERIPYRSTTGDALIGWVLYPAGHVAGRKLPVVTLVYPGRVYGENPPASLDPFNADFEHPQLFASLGYAVALPSMPGGENPLQTNALDALPNGVVPFLDVLVDRGIADPRRIALAGQSAGGWATLGLIGRSDRFRSAIASASYANLVSLYGTFYGQYRYGDAGHAQRAQLLRMLQFERGYYGADGPPWEQPDRYRINSPLWSAASVRTPLLLVHGDQDFIPIQQAEEFFTALFRQDKRVQLLRYAGEEHTIAARANVIDLWRRFEAWLAETMPAD